MTQQNHYVIFVTNRLAFVVIRINVVKSKLVGFFLHYTIVERDFLGDEFCKSSPPSQQQSPLEFNGGLAGVDDNFFPTIF